MGHFVVARKNVPILQKYLDNYDLSIKVIYTLGTLGFSIGTAVMAIFPDVYVAMIMISTMGIVSMSISYCDKADGKVVVVRMDFSKAFDSILHGRLVPKVKSHGIR
eukprot:g35285.t1